MLTDIPAHVLQSAAECAGGTIQGDSYETRYNSITQSSDSDEAASKWLLPGCSDSLSCCVCYSLCLKPVNCVRRGNEASDKIRRERHQLEQTIFDNLDDWRAADIQIDHMVTQLAQLDETSFSEHRSCCDQFIHAKCLDKHFKSVPEPEYAACPMCKSYVWPGMHLPFPHTAMLQKLLRFVCDHKECNGKIFETSTHLAMHFRDSHESEELVCFMGTVAIQDYERMRRMVAHYKTVIEEQRTLAGKAVKKMKEAAIETIKLQKVDLKSSRERSRSR